jgi:hypothetical protein
MAPQTSMFSRQYLHCNKGTAFLVRSVPRWYTYKQGKEGVGWLKSQSYFITVGLPPNNSSWLQAPWDSRLTKSDEMVGLSLMNMFVLLSSALIENFSFWALSQLRVPADVLERRLLRFSHCELLLLAAGNWGWVQFWNSEEEERPPLEAANQATGNEDCNRLRRPNVSYSDFWSVVTGCISVQ